jgi:hypothetical protein
MKPWLQGKGKELSVIVSQKQTCVIVQEKLDMHTMREGISLVPAATRCNKKDSAVAYCEMILN